jgi:hypothetical protein
MDDIDETSISPYIGLVDNLNDISHIRMDEVFSHLFDHAGLTLMCEDPIIGREDGVLDIPAPLLFPGSSDV